MIQTTIPFFVLGLFTLGSGLGAGVIAMLLWQRTKGIWVWTVVSILAYLCMDIVRQVIWVTAEYERGRHPFLFMLTAIYAVITLLILLRHSRHGKQNGDKS
jgi:amino acid permease